MARSPQTLAGAAGLAWTEPIEVARGPAHQGPWRMNDSEFHYVDDPTVAVADDGAIAVVNSSFREGKVSLIRLIRGRFDRAASPD